MKYIALIIFLLSSCYFVEAYQADVAISQTLPDTVYCGISYTKMFKIQNHDYKTLPDKTIVHVNYSYLDVTDVFNKTINSYSQTNTGLFFVNCSDTVPDDSVEICASVSHVTLLNGTPVSDNTTDNNHICFNSTLKDPLSVPCNMSLSFAIDDIIINGTKQHLYFNLSDTSFPFLIEYWITDIWGGVVKKKINTSNLNKKTYTPKSQGNTLGGYIAHARLAFVACNNSAVPRTFSLPFIAIFSSSDKSLFSVSTRKTEYHENEKIRIRLQGYKNETTKNAIFIKIYDDQDSLLSSQTFYATQSHDFFDFEFSYKLQACSNTSRLYIQASGLDIVAHHRINILPSCDATLPEHDNDVLEIIKKNTSLNLLSFYTLQKKISKDSNIKFFYRVSGSYQTHFRLYSLDDGYERHLVVDLNDTHKLNVTLPLHIHDNESSLPEVVRHYILTAYDDGGGYDFLPLTIILEHTPVKTKNSSILIDDTSHGNSSTPPFPTGYVGDVIYEDKSLQGTHYLVIFLFVAQGGFGAWLLKKWKRAPNS